MWSLCGFLMVFLMCVVDIQILLECNGLFLTFSHTVQSIPSCVGAASIAASFCGRLSQPRRRTGAPSCLSTSHAGFTSTQFRLQSKINMARFERVPYTKIGARVSHGSEFSRCVMLFCGLREVKKFEVETDNRN